MNSVQHRVLCIDNHSSRNLAVFLLEQADFNVTAAASVAGGLEMARDSDFDVYLVNNDLLREIEMCRKLRAWDPRVPLLFYSTVTYPFRKRRAREDNGKSSIQLVEISEVASTVSTLLGTKYSRRWATSKRAILRSAGRKALAAAGLGTLAILIMSIIRRLPAKEALSSGISP